VSYFEAIPGQQGATNADSCLVPFRHILHPRSHKAPFLYDVKWCLYMDVNIVRWGTLFGDMEQSAILSFTIRSD